MSDRSGYNGSRTHHTRNSSINARSQANNGHASADSSDEEGYDHGMRVGSDFQAVVPHINTVLTKPAPSSVSENAVLVWSPVNDIPEEKLDEFIQIAKDKYNYNMEQALGMLCWHKYDVQKALADMPNFTPFPDEWTVEDKVLFEQAFQFHDKHFQKIKQMLPDKSLASLVKYYYSWKKTRSRTSLMDRQVKKLNTQKDESDANSEAASENDSEQGNEASGSAVAGSSAGAAGDETSDKSSTTNQCENVNCGKTSNLAHFHVTSKGVLCRTCYSYWRRTGLMKQNDAWTRSAAANAQVKGGQSDSTSNNGKNTRKPPRGMYLNVDDLSAIAQGPPGQAEAILRALDQEVVKMKRQVQNNKQIISQLKAKTAAGIETMRLTETGLKQNPRWTTEEQCLAVRAFKKYGKDFKSISELLGTKSEFHLRSFFLNHDKKFGLSEDGEELPNNLPDDEESD